MADSIGWGIGGASVYITMSFDLMTTYMFISDDYITIPDRLS